MLGAGVGCETDNGKAVALFKRAAELGDATAQFLYCVDGFHKKEPGRYIWMCKAASNGHLYARVKLANAAEQQLKLFAKGGSGRLVFAIGEAVKYVVGETGAQTTNESIFGCDLLSILLQVGSLHDKWCERAKKAVWCWIWIAKTDLGILKDIRVLIANLIWEERASWTQVMSHRFLE